MTDKPSTIVTVKGAPLPENSATVGYPLAVHGEGPVLVTVTTPVMVPAAPWDGPADAVIWLQAAEAAVVDVVDWAAAVVLVDAVLGGP
ncbi:MAG TPA: hypothetical protein VEH82_08185 [Acidimicrobiales bacterium]|nr:hypothetical protein [Acidimicrobiales bacterium]